MSLSKLSDVKGHLRPPFLTKTPLDQLESQPDATGFSGVDPDAVETNPSNHTDDLDTAHSSSSSTVAQGTSRGIYLVDSIALDAPTPSKSVQS